MRCDLFILHFKSNFKKFWFVLFQKKKKVFWKKKSEKPKEDFFFYLGWFGRIFLGGKPNKWNLRCSRNKTKIILSCFTVDNNDFKVVVIVAVELFDVLAPDKKFFRKSRILFEKTSELSAPFAHFWTKNKSGKSNEPLNLIFFVNAPF